MGLFERILKATELNLVERNLQLEPVGKLDKYPESMLRDYKNDKKEWSKRNEK